MAWGTLDVGAYKVGGGGPPPTDPIGMYVLNGGVFKPTVPSVRVSSLWESAISGWHLVGGVWKQVYQQAVSPVVFDQPYPMTTDMLSAWIHENTSFGTEAVILSDEIKFTGQYGVGVTSSVGIPTEIGESYEVTIIGGAGTYTGNDYETVWKIGSAASQSDLYQSSPYTAAQWRLQTFTQTVVATGTLMFLTVGANGLAITARAFRDVKVTKV